MFRFWKILGYTVIVCLTITILSCPGDENAGFEGPSAVSLLDVTPYIGDEFDIRSPIPKTSRMLIDRESVGGWAMPEEGVLRFPVKIEKGAIFSLRLGITGYFNAIHGDLDFKVDYRVFVRQSGEVNSYISHNLFETSLENEPLLKDHWTIAETSLGQWSGTDGEIVLVLEGDLSNHPDLDILWGSPAVYYPHLTTNKNILLIGVDTLRADMLSVYGGPGDLTPALEEFAETSTTFLQNRSQSPWTLPSFASMVTGGLPSRIGATMLSWQLPDRAISIAEPLRENGYATGMVCSNAYLGHQSSGFQQGMESFWYEYNAPAGESIQQAQDFINRSDGRDWFCFLHFEDPHTPYTPRPEFRDRWCDPYYEGEFIEEFTNDADWKFSPVKPPDDDIDQVRNLHMAEIAYLDSQLGKLFSYLEENGTMDDTLIIFSSDHGEEFYEHDGFEHGHTQYDEQVRTPLIIMGDGFPEGEEIEDSVGNTDIVPTILEWIGLPIPEILEGVPLQEVISGEIENDRMIFGEDCLRGTQRKYGLEWPYKCIFDFETHTFRLYDLERDPGELEDRTDLWPEVAGRLANEIVLKMLPVKSTYNVWFMGSALDESGGFVEEPHVFSGTLRVPGGIDNVQVFALSGDDAWSVDADTVSFSITNADPNARVDKHFIIVPTEITASLEIDFLVDGEVRPDKLFPYGTNEPAESSTVSVLLTDFPLAATIPTGEQAFSGAMYVWGIQGFGEDVDRAEMDPETLAILESLGYIH